MILGGTTPLDVIIKFPKKENEEKIVFLVRSDIGLIILKLGFLISKFLYLFVIILIINFKNYNKFLGKL